MSAAPEPPADQEAGYAPEESPSGAGSPAGPRTQGRETGPAGKVGEDAAGRAAWRKAISDLHARQARGRKWGKTQRVKPGMLRKPPPGEGP